MPGLYLPPVLKRSNMSVPPHTIISLPVQIAVWESRASGALVVLVAAQLFVAGVYLPPVFKSLLPSKPPQTMIAKCRAAKAAAAELGAALAWEQALEWG